MTLQVVCDYIILIGAVSVALWNIGKLIAKLMGKPVTFVKGLREKERQSIIEEATNRSLSIIEPKLDEIIQQNKEQNERIQILNNSSRDMLRKQILDIYNEGKHTHQLTQTAREVVDELYKDYEKEDGNGYIKKKYQRMLQWDILSEDD